MVPLFCRQWAAGLVLALLVVPAARADEKPPDSLPRLRDGAFLTTDHLKQPLTLADGSKVHEFELHGGGKGKVGLTLYLVSPTHNLFGDPLPVKETDPPQPPPLPRRMAATLKPHAKADPAQRDRRLFVIEGEGLGDRLLLVVPAKERDSYRLVVRNKAGEVTDVVPLKVEPARIPPCHPGCFPAGTSVLTPRGPRPIEKVRVGDVVLNPLGREKPMPVKVASVFTGEAALVEVETEAGRLVSTARQPFTLAGGEPKSAGELSRGDTILRWQDGKAVAVQVRGVRRQEKPARVFNLVLETPGTFIANGYLVRSKPPAE